MAELFYNNDKTDLYEGLIIEMDDGLQTQIAQVFPAGREYGLKFAAAPKMAQLLLESRKFIGGDWRERRDKVLQEAGLL